MFVGLTGWQTGTVIRSISVITLDQACAQKAMEESTNSATVTEESNNTTKNTIGEVTET